MRVRGEAREEEREEAMGARGEAREARRESLGASAGRARSIVAPDIKRRPKCVLPGRIRIIASSLRFCLGIMVAPFRCSSVPRYSS